MSTSKGAVADAVHGAVAGVECVANILERESSAVTKDWFSRVELETDLMSVPLNYEKRTRHLPQLLHEVIARLRQGVGSKASISKAAAVHGGLRRTQGYSAAMIVQESRLLELTIFSILHRNVRCLDFATLLPDIAIIGDEVDAQLSQQMQRFMAI